MPEVEEREQDNRFGIPFHHEDVTASTGCIARLVEVARCIPRPVKDIVVECVNLFTTNEIHVAGTHDEPPYPTGNVERLPDKWKNWTSVSAESSIATLAQYWKSHQGDPEAEGPVGSLTEAMVRYDFNPIERHEVLRCKSEEKRLARFAETVQFKALIVQQMQLKSKGQFPN